MSRKEDRLQYLMSALPIFNKAILKTQTNLISVKLGLIGKILREYSRDSIEITNYNGKDGILIEYQVYSKLIEDNQNIMSYDFESGYVFVTQDYCEECKQEIQNLEIEAVVTFLDGFTAMPAELAAEFLASDIFPQIVNKLEEHLLKEDILFEFQTKIFGLMFGLRDILESFQLKLNLNSNEEPLDEPDLINIINRNIDHFDKTGI